MDPLSEFDVVRNGTDLWTYTSRGNTVQHGTAPQHSDTRSTAPSAGAMASMTPDQLAAKAIATADPTTEISVGPSQVVAGRSAYALTLTPRDKGTLIDHIVIGVDAEKSVPLQVKVFARGHGDPVIETGFTDVDFSTPPASTFAFTPPKGATVTQLGTGDHSATQPKKPAGGSTATTPTVTGTGWASIVELPASAMQAMASGSAASHPGSTGSTGSGPSSAAAMMQLTTPVAGGRAISTSLVSVLLTNDGRVFAGSVPVQALVDAAAK
jgi:outer membrane lipoprotein-sorting protein